MSQLGEVFLNFDLTDEQKDIITGLLERWQPMRRFVLGTDFRSERRFGIPFRMLKQYLEGLKDDRVTYVW